MHYLIYQLTNQLNGKIYIGSHITEDIQDGYIGKGKELTEAILQDGFQNFKKEILYDYDDEEQMREKEAELLTWEFINRSDTYNRQQGRKHKPKYNESRKLSSPANLKKNIQITLDKDIIDWLENKHIKKSELINTLKEYKSRI